MKKILILSLLTIVFSSQLKAEKIDFNIVLDSIEPLEGTPYYSFRGKRGERSPVQMTYKTWKQHTNKPFWWASDPLHKEFTRQVAIKHLQWLYSNIENPSVYRLFLSWNAGLTNVNRGTLIEAHFDYATRGREIYNEKMGKLKLCLK